MTKSGKKSRANKATLFDDALDAIRDRIDLPAFTAADIPNLVVVAMNLAEKIPSISGPDKKDMVIQLANLVVSELTHLEGPSLLAVQTAVDLIVPNAIDQLVAASKNQLELNVIEQEVVGCFACCRRTKKVATKKQSKKSRVPRSTVLDSAYDAIKEQINMKTFGLGDIPKFAVIAMSIVEKIPTMSGPEKKDAVIQLAKRLVGEIPSLDESTLSAIQSAIQFVLPGLIDQIVAASKGQLDFNAIKDQIAGCFSSCFGSKTSAQ